MIKNSQLVLSAIREGEAQLVAWERAFSQVGDSERYNYPLFLRCARSALRGMIRSFSPSRSMSTRTGTDDPSLKGKALSSTRCFGRYRKYFPSVLLAILPVACATNLHHSTSMCSRLARGYLSQCLTRSNRRKGELGYNVW